MAYPTTEKFVSDAEQLLMARLPTEFRNRLLANNGGELSTSNDDWQVFPVLDSTDRKRTSRTVNNIVRESQLAASWPLFPKGAVAVAENGTGDLLIFLRDADTGALSGRLYEWSHESGECKETSLDYS
jgi:SMI1 / KNR4 family (SUKH-1)